MINHIISWKWRHLFFFCLFFRVWSGWRMRIVKTSVSGCRVAFALFLVNLNLVLLIKVFLIKKRVTVLKFYEISQEDLIHFFGKNNKLKTEKKWSSLSIHPFYKNKFIITLRWKFFHKNEQLRLVLDQIRFIFRNVNNAIKT